MPVHGAPPARRVEQLKQTLEAFDEAGAHRVLSRVFAELGVEDALSEVVLPYLRDVGDRWAAGSIGVAQEHFASNVLRTRLSMLLHDEAGLSRAALRAHTARPTDSGSGDGSRAVAVLACLPGEQHEFGLMAVALTLSRLGWRVCYLGASTPTAELARVCRTLRPDAVVLSAHRPTAYAAQAPALRRLAESTAVFIGAAGASGDLADLCHATHLDRDPVSSAREVDDELGGAVGACGHGPRPFVHDRSGEEPTAV